MIRIGSASRFLVGAFVVGLAAGPGAIGQGSPPRKPVPVPVRVERSGSAFSLSRGGKPYLIQGGGGDGSLKTLAEAGGNSVRTWGLEGVGARLDEAERLGLTVTVGIWLGHERHGFHYNDAGQVADQFEMARQAIQTYKNHPALLVWGIGNEMEAEGANAAIWSAINNIAAMAHQLDPNHPTMTVLAEIGGDKVKNVHRLCPAIDIVGINSYGPVASVPERYRKAGGTKPYVLTEFGPAGAWETPRNAWDAAPERSSTAKAESYRLGWLKAVAGSGGLAVGGYAFLWGHKQEATATWFGMLLPDGSRLAAVDAMTEVWTGKPPANRCPAIEGITHEASDRVGPGEVVRARLKVRDPEGDPIQVVWVLQEESRVTSAGGDAEAAPPTFPDALIESAADHAVVKMPRGGGGYRLFAFVRDGHGGAAVANVPLFVNAPVEVAPARRATLPLVLYDEADRARLPYAPSGWMGNAQGLKLVPDHADRPHAGKSCLRLTYSAGDGWAGVVWQDPANDWGDVAGGYDLKGAKRLSFWARGEKGGEVVNFGFGLNGPGKKFPDSARLKLDGVTLSRDWKPYTIDLGAADLARIKSGFVCSLAGSGAPTTFYLDDIVVE
jgi:hypothetical protein